MIIFDDVSVSYDGNDHPTLSGVSFTVEEGELTLVVGATGSGKSTLLRCINGLVPHFSGGRLSGRVVVDGRDTRHHRPRDLAEVVGFVMQDPAASFVTDTVEEEIAYGLETLGVEAQAMRRRVEETLDLLGLAEIRSAPLTSLSGGQQQRVAIGAVLAAGPRVLVLDEPTSALDPVAAEDVLAALHRLVHDLGITVVIAEHRLERVIHHADSVLLLASSSPGSVTGPLDPAEAMSRSAIHPPLIDLGRTLDWSPLPLSVRDARRRAADLRTRWATATPTSRPLPDGPTLASVSGLGVSRGSRVVLRDLSLELHAGSVTALMGRNGAGKSTLLATLVGQLTPTTGRTRVGDLDPAQARPIEIVRRVGLVPQDPMLLLYSDTVAGECDSADRDFALRSGTTAATLERIAPGLPRERHPRDLSEGQRLSLALAVALASRPPLLLLDEPTRGLDYAAKRRLVELLVELRDDGHGVLLATHDVELAAEVADRVLVIADGEVVADGPCADVLSGSPAFAPQVAKVLHPVRVLTVDEVRSLLESEGVS